MTKQRYYICIDLKSFYASVEAVERGLHPMTVKLVVAGKETGFDDIYELEAEIEKPGKA